MDIKPGTRLGPYEIVSSIGKGGMGEVWKARDTRLNRDVAIKISAQQFTDRFEVEAHAIAALNHSNICILHDIGPNYLVMELIEGPTLAERVAEGPLALEEALAIAKQIADALEAAHEKGITHRDLKPANVKIRPDGSVKVLDFGLAKATEASAAFTSESPTIMSIPGTILGTAGYMAPEQARGKTVDKRADIWAFGVVLYEMTARRRLFEGETVSDTLAAVIMKEPDLPLAPAKVQRLLRRCLEKDPRLRLRDIGDAMPLLEEVPLMGPAAASRGGFVWIAAAAIFALIAAALAFVHFREKPAEPVLRFTVPPEKGTFPQNSSLPAVSPDGRHVAYVATMEGKAQLWVRDLDSLTSRLLFAETSRYPFWSPDSRSIGFFSEGKLRKVDASGGPALTLCDAAPGFGGTWNRNGVILFSPSRTAPIFRVAAAGGIPTPVTEVEKASGERTHHHPGFLPDGRHFLYTALAFDEEKIAIYVGDLESRERRRVMAARSNAIYASPGFLLFLREHTLMAQPFDAGKLETTGDPFPIAEQVNFTTSATGQFSASQNGVLAYISGLQGGAQLTWFDRSGKTLGTVGSPMETRGPAISPDGKTVAFERLDPQTGFNDIWLHDLARGTDSRFTFNSKNNLYPIWSPDGSYIAFASNRNGRFNVYRKATGGTGQDEIVDRDALISFPDDWSPDGRYLLADSDPSAPKTLSDIWVAPMARGRSAGKPYPYLQTEFSEGLAKVSPNGQWLAYSSNETKRNEVYVMTFPNPGGKWQISTSGGTYPVWSRNGKELFFVSADNKMMAVDIGASGGKLEAGIPRALFDVRLTTLQGFDVSKDGKFLVPTPVEQTAAVPMTVVVNWPATLRK
jgi:Tol biopolymer transport system component/tRNA A-37 threonylcarbamoyl transferase component Bud32